jgi:hypothetical protein
VSRPAIQPYEPPPPSPIRGLLPVPPEVAKFVAREVKRLPMSDAARQRLTNTVTLQYYFGGHVVACRATPQGIEVLAAGLDEIGRFFKKVPHEQRQGVFIDHPELW